MKYIISIVVFVALISLVSAEVTCDLNTFTVTYPSGQIPSGDILITSCSKPVDNNTTEIKVTGTGVPQYISLGSDSQSISANKNIKINIESNIPKGLYPVTISFVDGVSNPISAVIEVDGDNVVQGDILVFPTSKVLTVQQEQEKTQNILITVPSSYPRTVTIQSVDFNPGTETITFGDLNLGQVQPGQSVSIPIVFSGKDAQTGTYQTSLNIFATDSEGQIDLPTISLQLQVTSGVTPVDDDFFQTRPSCSLSASVMNLNNTYSFTCSGVSNNVEINPIFNEFFVGTDVDISSNIYTYTFKPIKFGNTDFEAFFTYRGSPIFEPYTQEVKIQATSGQTPGSELKLIFTPSLSEARDGETVAIQIVDNKTNSLVESPELFIKSLPVTNKSSRTFFYSFNSDTNYSVRATASGYSDLVTDISLTSKPITLKIEPESGNSVTQFKITSDENATIIIDDESKGEVFEGTLSAGNRTILAVKEGYLDTEITLNVDPAVTFTTSGEFKKGVIQTITLSKEAEWSVFYQEDESSSRQQLANGRGDVIEFEPTKRGIYFFESEGSTLRKEITGLNWKEPLGLEWYWWAGGLAIIAALVVFITGRSSTESNEVPFGANISG